MESETQQLSSSITLTATTKTTVRMSDNNNRDDEYQHQPTKIVLFVEGPLCMRRHDTTLSLLQDVMVYLNGFLARYDSGSFDFLYRHFTWLKRDSIMNLRYFLLTNVQILLSNSDFSASDQTSSSTATTSTPSSTANTKKKWNAPLFFKLQRKDSKQCLHTLDGIEKITASVTDPIRTFRTTSVNARPTQVAPTTITTAVSTDVIRNNNRRGSKDFFRHLMHLPTKSSTTDSNDLTLNLHKQRLQKQQLQEVAVHKQITSVSSRPLLVPLPKPEDDDAYVLMGPVSLQEPQTPLTSSATSLPSPTSEHNTTPITVQPYIAIEPVHNQQYGNNSVTQPQQEKHRFNITETMRSISLESNTSVYVSANSSPTLQTNTQNRQTLSTTSLSSSSHTGTSTSDSSTSPPSSPALLTPASSLGVSDVPLSQASSNQSIFEEYHHPSLDEIEYFVQLQTHINNTIVDFNSKCVVDDVPITRFLPPNMLAPNYHCAYRQVENRPQSTSTFAKSSSSIAPLPHMVLNMAIIENDELSYTFAFNESSIQARSSYNDHNINTSDRTNLLDEVDNSDIASLDNGHNFINNLSKFFRKRKSLIATKPSNGFVGTNADNYYEPDTGISDSKTGSDKCDKSTTKRAQRSHSSPAVFNNIMFMSAARNKLSQAFIKWKVHTQQIPTNNARHILLRSKSFVESAQTTTGYMNVTNRICQIRKPPPVSAISSLPVGTITGRLQVGRELQSHNQCLDIAWHGRYFVIEQTILYDLCMDFVFSLNGYIIEPQAYSFRFQSRILNNRKIWDYIYSLWDTVAQTSIRLGYRPLFVWTLPMCEHVEFLNDHAHHISFSHFNIRHFIINQIYTYRTIYAVFNIGYHLRANKPDISSDDIVRTVRQLLLLESCE